MKKLCIPVVLLASLVLGLAACMSGGLRAFAVDGGWSKWLHVGWAAHGGIVAAQMAAHGFRGPEHVLDGGYDLYSALLHGDTDYPAGCQVLEAGCGTGAQTAIGTRSCGSSTMSKVPITIDTR